MRAKIVIPLAAISAASRSIVSFGPTPLGRVIKPSTAIRRSAAPTAPSLREAQRRSNPFRRRGLDCFASLAMTALRGSHGEDGRARRLTPFEIAMRLRRVLQRIGLVDGDLDRAAADDVEELLRHGDEILALGGVG